MTVREPAFSWGWLLAAAAALAADLFLHLPVTNVFDALSARLGLVVYDRLLEITFALFGVAALVTVATRRNRSGLLLATALLVAVTIPVEGLLPVASVENIHYPQYALLTFLLDRGGLSTEASWLLATGLGVVDEGHQYLFLHRGTPNYLDWNDIVLNGCLRGRDGGAERIPACAGMTGEGAVSQRISVRAEEVRRGILRRSTAGH